MPMLHDDDLITNLPNGGYLIIKKNRLDEMERFRQKTRWNPESGGVLVGQWYKEIGNARTHMEITTFTTPNKGDKQTRYSSVRRGNAHIEAVMNAWHQSDHRQTYIGEWHTHPEAYPKPSQTDLKQWYDNLLGRNAILIILGTKGNWIAFWDGKKPNVLEGFTPIK